MSEKGGSLRNHDIPRPFHSVEEELPRTDVSAGSGIGTVHSEDTLHGKKRTAHYVLTESIIPLGVERESSIATTELPILIKPVALRLRTPTDVERAIDCLSPTCLTNLSFDKPSHSSPTRPHSLETCTTKDMSAYNHGLETRQQGIGHPRPVAASSQTIGALDPVSSLVLWKARRDLLSDLKTTKGETNTAVVEDCLAVLRNHYTCQQLNARVPNIDCDVRPSITGMWQNLAKPLFPECLGVNRNGDPMYTMSRMLCLPYANDLICSLQQNYNSIQEVPNYLHHPRVPDYLREYLQQSCERNTVLHTYDMITCFTLESTPLAHANAIPLNATSTQNSDNSTMNIQGIYGKLCFQGFCISDPTTNNRHVIWLTEGRIETDWKKTRTVEGSTVNWKHLLASTTQSSRGESTISPSTTSALSQSLPGNTHSVDGQTLHTHAPASVADDTTMNDESLSFVFACQFGGPGVAYVDTLYQDSDLRIIQGHRGSLFVFTMVHPDAVTASC